MPFDAASYIMGKNASGGGGSTVTVEPLSVTQNGEYAAPDGKAYTPVTVNVPNTYSAGDEGKVVDGGELVAQTSLTVTENGTVDTTLNNSVVVNVPTGGGGGVSSNDVNFIDYDGTIVASYSAADFANLTELPANPSHSGLTAQGWNWSLADAKTYVASYGFLDIGQMYVTDDGKTRLYVHFEEGRTSPYLGICPSGTVDIDWGDGSAHDTLTGTSIFSAKTVQHVYQPGDYVITLTPASGTTYSIPGYTSNNAGTRLLDRALNGSAVYGSIYRVSIQKVELGIGIVLGNTPTPASAFCFANCYNLKSITIPKSITLIAERAFYGCHSLKHITVPSETTALGAYCFSSCAALGSISLPNTVTTISANMCYGSYVLPHVAIPSVITELSSSLFQRCYGMVEVEIPSSVTSIGSYTFGDCGGLVKIRFHSSTPPTATNGNAWNNISSSDVKIYVPYAGLASYLTATNYPSSATYTYLGFATYASGATLPTQDTTSAYNVTWYATKEDAIAGTNPITQGNGSEVYCTYAAV